MGVVIEDASGIRGEAERVVAPSSPEEAAALLREADETRTPVTVSGAGTGVVGGRCPSSGGWSFSLEKFQKLEIETGVARVGAGVLLRDVMAAAQKTGQFYAPDPTEWSSTIGGNIATNASGSRSFRYGATRRHLRALRVARMDGTVRTYRRGELVDFPYTPLPVPRTTKNTAGYFLPPNVEWVDLFCGSDGTLGVVLEAELALLPQPKAILSGVVFFPNDELTLAAVEAWRPIVQLRMLEYLDAPSLEFLRARYSDIPREAQAALLVEQELDGLAGDAVDEWLERLEETGALGEASWFGETAADRERFRLFRHTLPELVNDHVRKNGCEKLSSDFAVPLERNGEMLAFYKETLGRAFPGKYTIFGHIGDAHVHVNVLSETVQDFEAGKAWMLEAARQSVALGGTVSAEHGLGKRKVHFLPLMYTAEQMDAMKNVKRNCDPHWLLGRDTMLVGDSSLGV